MEHDQSSTTFRGGLVAWLVYPVTMVACVGLHVGLAAAGVVPLLAAYAGVLLGAVAIVVFERVTPARREWMADRVSVLNDLMFMVVVQMLLPKFLSFLVAVTLVRGLAALGWSPEHLWVHGWPFWAQAVLMVLLADFLRYWLHVASHRFPVLWRLHAVHHSPKKLYWLNVGRFHPLEKGIQFLCDALPFILVGVGEEVLALYFVFYAVNGFFQHCNIRLRFGWLNYLISSAELHRWHHSKTIAESDRNFGNNVIVWDLLFGTWFLPEKRVVGELGLRNDHYPQGFEPQIRAPFVSTLDHKDAPVLGWRDIMLNWCSQIALGWIRLRLYEPLKLAARDPGKEQRDVLRRILGTHAGTDFGRDHGLSREMGVEAFREKVPVSDYERLRRYIERQEETGAAALNPERPVIYNVTSGTVGEPKYLPVTREVLKALARDQRLVTYFQSRACPEGFVGKTLGIVSPAIEGRMPSGVPFGSASGQIYREMPWLARAKYVLPAEVFELSDYTAKYYVILRLALAHRDITYLGSANPSTFLRLLELVGEHGEALVRDLEEGGCQFLDGADERLREVVLGRCRPEPERAAEVRTAIGADGELDFPKLWPHVRVVTTWTGGSCGVALASLRSKLHPETAIIDLGFLASELRVTITVDAESGAGVPTLRQNYFEFVEREAWESGRAEFLGLEEIEQGGSYYLFVTTPAGLFRYPMNDIVEVVGRFEQTPTLRFLQKGAGVTNITGEKVHEFQVLEAIGRAEASEGFHSDFVQVLADEEASRYLMYLEVDGAVVPGVERVVGRVDEELGRLNIEYRAKRESGRLMVPLVVFLRHGALAAYKAKRVREGTREAQFKTVALRYRRDFDFDFSPFVLGAKES